DQDPVFAPSAHYQPQEAVRLDAHGHARILPIEGSQLYMPFVDTDGDGQADVDALGFYIIQGGARVSPYHTPNGVSPYLETLGNGHLLRLGQPVFEYFDLQATPLAYLIREGSALFLDNTVDEGLRVIHTLLGPTQTYTDAQGSYPGFSRTGGVVQILTALFAGLDHDAVGSSFEAIITLLKSHPDAVAALLHSLEIISDIAGQTPTHFEAGNLIDRLMPLLHELSQTPGLIEDLVLALDDPLAAQIAPILAHLAKQKKRFIRIDDAPGYHACFSHCDATYRVGTMARLTCIQACPTKAIIGETEVDRLAPESPDNRSLLQRVTHLMWETSETPYNVTTNRLIVKGIDITELAATLGALIEFDNLAEAYLLTITGDLHLSAHLMPSLLELGNLLGIEAETLTSVFLWMTKNLFDLDLSLQPTTAEVTRLFNMPAISSQNDNYVFDLTVAMCRSGFTCLQASADTLFAIEATGLVDALYPVVKVFNDHGRTATLAKIMALLFEYYPSEDRLYDDIHGEPLPLRPGNFRSLEPLLARALGETDVVPQLGELGSILLGIEFSDGSVLTSRVAEYLAYWLTPDPNLKNIHGLSHTTDPDGNLIAPLSPAYLVIDALRDISKIMDAHPGLDDQMTRALDGIRRVTVQTQIGADGHITFQKPAGIRLVATGLEFLLNLYLEETEQGTRTAWIRDTIIPETQALISGRILQAFFALFEALDAQPMGLENFRKLILHLMQSDSHTPTHLTGAAYQLFSLLLQHQHLAGLAHFAADAIDPDRVWLTEGLPHLSFVVTLLTCVNAFNQRDPTASFNRLFYQLFQTDTRKIPNFVSLMQVAYALLRPQPGTHTYCDTACMKNTIGFVHDVFTDDQRGVERIFLIIDFTIWGMAGRPADWESENTSSPISQ
ncbi:MAG: hypothetical protein FWC40_09810, partial [Proteobacteria bacterium]|nr:hypothetical protein [Pseudomonadota bacterium]